MDLKGAAELNQEWWDAIGRQRDAGLIAKHHDVAADLRQGKTALYPEQRALLGDVRGRRLLDLGCGDGMELVELAVAGANVVGVDISPRQLAAAQRAADALGVRCRLVQANLLQLPDELLRGEFDIVFSSHATAWIGDLDRWFSAVHRALAPGGLFLLRGGHALVGFFTDQRGGSPTRTSYFDQGPFVRHAARSPEWNPLGEKHTFVEWSHTLGVIVTAVAQAGLHITHLIELEGDANNGVGYPEAFVLRATNG